MDAADVMFALFAVCVLLAVFLLARRMRLGAGHMLFDCVLRAPDLQRPRWRPGLARYQGDHLQWFALWSFRLGPAVDIARSKIVDITLAQADERRSVSFYEDAKLVTIRAHQDASDITIEMLLANSSSLGLMSWIEAGPRQYSQH